MPWNTLFFASLVLMLAEHMLQDYFVEFFYRSGWTVSQKTVNVDWDPTKVPIGATQTTTTSAFSFSKDGQTCYFRYKHRLFIPLVPFVFFRGVAERKEGKVQVTVRMNVAQFLVLLCAEDLTGNIYLGVIATVLAFFGFKGYFGLNPIEIVGSYFDDISRQLEFEVKED
ncbi:MAG: hypothetical protein ACE5GM_05935 [bacterium]